MEGRGFRAHAAVVFEGGVQMFKRGVFVLWLILALVAGVSSSCAATPAPSGVAPIQTTAPGGPAPVPVKLRVAIPQMEVPDAGLAALGMSSMDQPLRDSLNNAAVQIGKDLGLPVELSVEPYPLTMYAGGPICAIPWMVGFDGYDAVLLDSNSALTAFHDQAFASIPMDLFQGYLSTVSSEVGNAFSDPRGTLVGVVQATSPGMIIYNPDRMGPDAFKLQETVRFEDMLSLTENHPLALPPYPAIAMILLQSAMPDLTFEQMLDPGLYDRIPQGFLMTLDALLARDRANRNIYAADQMEIAQWFYDGKIDWTMDDSRFLAALKQLKYEGPVAVARLPRGLAQGAGAMGVSWVVPAASQNQELAWALIAQVVQEPGASQWALANGMVPASQPGFEQGLTAGFARQLLPPGLLAGDPKLSAMAGIARDSKMWLLPAGLSAEQYQNLYLTANDLFVGLVAGDLTLNDAMKKWQDLLVTIQQ
jgi:hypothetical protein